MRGAFVIAAGIAAFLSCPALADGHKLDPSDPDQAFKARTKVFCSLAEGKPSIYWWQGTVYSRIRGEKDRHLFNVHGVNVRACKNFDDPVRGVGSRSVSREVMFYMNKDTGEVQRTWENPWTGEEVEIVHVANDPVNSRGPSYARDEEGKGTANLNSTTVVNGTGFSGGGAARLFYKNPLAGEYQDYVGNHYHAAEFLTSAVPMDDLLDASKTEVTDSVISWGRISRWMPWMKMGGRDGLLVHYTGGMRLETFEDLPEVVKAEIRTNYPEYENPPPLDDARPNETSWTVFKKWEAEKRAAEGGSTDDSGHE